MKKCTRCGLCDAICPAEVDCMQTSADKKTPYLKYPDECWHCGTCRQDFPDEAIEIQFPPDKWTFLNSQPR
jgi:NAD-dependent dihydropyrimidine dehydrogenase PreA subunit